MRFRQGMRWFKGQRRTRGRSRHPYTMTRPAEQARVTNASKARAALARKRRDSERTYGETRRIELEIALASHGFESYRQIARRVGLRSHAHCWRVIRRYRTGQIPYLPPDEESLLAMRESLGLGENLADTALAEPARAIIRNKMSGY